MWDTRGLYPLGEALFNEITSFGEWVQAAPQLSVFSQNHHVPFAEIKVRVIQNKIRGTAYP